MKLPEAPTGRPLMLKVTSPPKPPVGVIVTPYVVEAPCVTIRLAGEALSKKSGDAGALTTSVRVQVCVRLPLAPVIVSV